MNAAKKKHWQAHTGVVLDSVNNFDVIECKTCQFKHIIPIPTTSELASIYQHDYYDIDKPFFLETQRQDLEWWQLVYNERFQEFESLLPSHRRRILDVGSGPGFFLQHGQMRGWQTTGIEPSIKACAHSRKLGVETINAFLTTALAQTLQPFDVIHMHEVLEHLPDPKKMLQLSRNLLISDGLLCITVPNDYNPLQQALQTHSHFRPWWVAPPHHINYFDSHSLCRLLRSCGFDIVTHETTFPIEIFLLMGDNYVDNSTLGRQCHKKRMNLETTIIKAGLGHLKREWYKNMAKIGLGREIVLICKTM